MTPFRRKRIAEIQNPHHRWLAREYEHIDALPKKQGGPTRDQIVEREIAEKKEALRKTKSKITRAEIFDIELSTEVQYAGSYDRLPVLLEHYNRGRSCRGGRRIWFRHLGREWEHFDNVSEYHDNLVAILGRASLQMRSEMMNEKELTRFRKLPKIVTAHRGCGRKNRLGLAWTLKRAVAERFLVSGGRYGGDTLITARVPKARIVAVKLARGEKELIALVQEKHITAEDHISAPPESSEANC